MPDLKLNRLRDRTSRAYAKRFSGGRAFGSLREYAAADHAQGWDDAAAVLALSDEERVAVQQSVAQIKERGWTSDESGAGGRWHDDDLRQAHRLLSDLLDRPKANEPARA